MFKDAGIQAPRLCFLFFNGLRLEVFFFFFPATQALTDVCISGCVQLDSFHIVITIIVQFAQGFDFREAGLRSSPEGDPCICDLALCVLFHLKMEF